MQNTNLRDGNESFKVSVYNACLNAPTVLFAAGAGGLPERYSTLLNTLVDGGFKVIAPHFQRLIAAMPNKADLALRARRFSLALDAFAKPETGVAGVGHSIGAAVLVALSGAQMWLGPNRPVNTIVPDNRLTRLSLLAAPTDFFQAPGAFDGVKIPILALVGSADDITPPAQTERIAHAMLDRQIVEMRVIEGAGHFSFMDKLPPQIKEPLPDKQAFLKQYSRDICRFLNA